MFIGRVWAILKDIGRLSSIYCPLPTRLYDDDDDDDDDDGDDCL